ncbi:MAG: hypothetical protein QOI34_795 [Verrucomicrobiota bacterium]
MLSTGIAEPITLLLIHTGALANRARANVCYESLLTRGLEPPRVSPYGPEPYASANSAT